MTLISLIISRLKSVFKIRDHESEHEASLNNNPFCYSQWFLNFHAFYFYFFYSYGDLIISIILIVISIWLTRSLLFVCVEK